MLHFSEWLQQQEKDMPNNVLKLLADLNRGFAEKDTLKVSEITNMFIEMAPTSLLPLLDDFRKHGRQVLPTFLVWDDFKF